MKTTPLYHNDPLMMGAWAACLSWAISKPEIREAFKKETGHDIDSIVAAKGLNKLIDESTGRTRETMHAWCDWATKNIWGAD